MLIYGKPGIIFECQEFICLLNDQFNIVIFCNYTAFHNKKAHSVGFVVPINYLDFIKTISTSYSLETDLKKIFTFKKENDFVKLKEFVAKQNKNSDYKIINELLTKPQRNIKIYNPFSKRKR